MGLEELFNKFLAQTDLFSKNFFFTIFGPPALSDTDPTSARACDEQIPNLVPHFVGLNETFSGFFGEK